MACLVYFTGSRPPEGRFNEWAIAGGTRAYQTFRWIYGIEGGFSGYSRRRAYRHSRAERFGEEHAGKLHYRSAAYRQRRRFDGRRKPEWCAGACANAARHRPNISDTETLQQYKRGREYPRSARLRSRLGHHGRSSRTSLAATLPGR